MLDFLYNNEELHEASDKLLVDYRETPEWAQAYSALNEMIVFPSEIPPSLKKKENYDELIKYLAEKYDEHKGLSQSSKVVKEGKNNE